MVDVSIVIVCMNRPDNLYPCLRSIHEHTLVDFECLVVAYLYDKAALEQARADFPRVKFIESDEIRGFSENNNLALREAKGRYCFILNDDTEFDMDVIGRLMSDFDRLPENAAIVSPKLLNPDGTLQLCGRPPYPSHCYALQQWHLYREPIDNVKGKTPIFDQVYRSWNITGAAFLIRRDVFERLGWFDERYFFTPEDLALGTLACERGYSLWVDASVEVIHKWKTTASRISPAVRPAAVKGSLMFFGRRGPLSRLLLSVCVWCAEYSKYIKACLRCRRDPTPSNLRDRETFRNISREIFSPLTPKEIFIKYFHHAV